MGNGLNTDGNRLVSHGSNSPNNKNVCTLHGSSAWSFDFCLSTMITPSAGDGQTSSLSENDLTTDCFDLLPFVEFTGRPGIALHDSVNRKNLKTILAPLQFDNVYSIHVSPDGKLIWCLVPPRNLSTNNHQNNLATNNVSNNDNCKSFSVDVCLESGGLKSLLKAWDSNEIGQWEFNVLLQITSVDLSNTYAVFSTSSGHLKIQTGLSSKRPYNQSYTWPCPGYHILQVATCLSGLVWCLAIKQLNDETESLPSNDDGFVLLSSTLPVSITHRNTFPQVKSVSNTTTTTSVVDQLKQLKWSTCFTLPSLLSRSLFERFISAGNLLTLSDLTSAVNFELQIVLISQKEKMSMDKKDNNSLIDCKYHSITGWILVTYHSQESKAYNNSNIHSSNGFIQMIIETEGDYELVTDWNQFTISEISCSGSAMNKSGFSDFIMKHISPKPKDLITYSVPLIRYTHSIIKNKDHINDDNESKPNQLIFNQPMRITLQQSWNKTTVVMQPIKSSSCLSTYQWQQHHYVLPEFGNANNLLIMHTFSTLNRNSNNNNNNVFIKSLWIPDRRSLTNRGIKCYAETQVKSVIDLFIPYPNENDQNEKLTVSAMCTLANELLSSGDYPLQLFIAFTNGLFMSRIGVSNQNPIGTRWLTLSCPDLWKNKDLNTNPTVITYFTSLSCIKMKLWATDSQGRLFSSKLLLNNNTTNKDDSYWEALTWNLDSTSDNDPSSQLQSIYFTSINGASWEFYGLGTCLWSIGGICCPLQKSNIDNNPFEFLTNIRYEFQKQISMNSINHQSVYVRCFKEDCNPDKCFYWLHVPSPPCKSIHVSNNGVWLLSSTYPSQIYYRIGLPMNQYDNNNSNINYTDPLPAPKNYHIGYAWQSIASPSVFDYHSLNLAAIYIPFSTDFIIQFKNSDVFSANSSSSKQSTSIPACYSLKSYHYPIILYALTDTGLFLSLSSGPIVKFNAYCNSSIDENVESTQLLLSTCNIHDSEHNELIIIGSKSNSLTS
ncbi:unnamed protein product [Heterobilharzia americana]|nr:unnamed protein product [Heterobilharzia americana]